MRAVIFAAALLAGASGWLLLEGSSGAPSRLSEMTGEASPSVRSLYRAERAACGRGETKDRACERRARERLHAKLKHEAARLSLR